MSRANGGINSDYLLIFDVFFFIFSFIMDLISKKKREIFLN
jgi:hypothetical protein